MGVSGIRAGLLIVAGAVTGCGGGASTPIAPAVPTSSETQAGVPVANEGWIHVPEGSTVTYRNNPPASGPHYPVWLRYQLFTEALPRGYWVHNLEHGSIVLLHRPDASAAGIETLRAAYRSLPVDASCGHTRALLVPDPDLDVPFAAVAADWVLEMAEIDRDLIHQFTIEHRGRAPENVCEGGTRP